MTSIHIPTFQQAVRSKDKDRIETCWLELLEEKPIAADHGLHMLESMASAGQKAGAADFAELLENELMDARRFEDALAIIRLHKDLVSDTFDLWDRCIQCMKAVYGERHDQFSECLSHAMAADTGDRNLADLMARMDKLMVFAPGNVVHHHSRGLGIVNRLQPEDHGVIVDFTSKPGHRFDIDLAITALTGIEEGSLMARVARDPEAVKQQTYDDPAAIIRSVLETSKGELTLRDLRTKLTDLVLTNDEWSKWWQKARPRLVSDPLVEMSGQNNKTLRLRKEAVDPIQAVIEKDNPDNAPAERVDQMRRAYGSIPEPGDYPDSAGRFAAMMLEWVQTWSETNPGAAFCAWKLAQAATAASSGSLEDIHLKLPTDISKACEWLGDMRIASQVDAFLDWLAEQQPAMAEELLPAMLESGPDASRQVSLKRLAETNPDLLEETIRRIVDDHETAVPAFLWICTQIARSKVKQPEGQTFAVLYESLLQVLQGLQVGRFTDESKRRESMASTTKSLLMDERLVTRALQDGTEEQISRMRVLSTRLRDAGSAVKETIEHHMVTERPEILAAEAQLLRKKNSIWTTREGLNNRKNQLRKIVEEDLPQAGKEMGEAARFGDLSENSEFEAAREERFRLADEAKAIEAEIEKAYVPNVDDIDTDIVGFGTRVYTVRRDDKDGTEDEIVYDILGPWDSEHLEGIISYLTPVAQGLTDASPGEERTVEIDSKKMHYRIEKIELSPAFTQKM